jgi:hypothetical protein
MLPLFVYQNPWLAIRALYPVSMADSHLFHKLLHLYPQGKYIFHLVVSPKCIRVWGSKQRMKLCIGEGELRDSGSLPYSFTA